MTSLYQHNQTDPIREPLEAGEELPSAIENPEKEIYALRQQLQALKTLYNKGATVPAEAELSLPAGKPYFAETPAALDPIRQRNDRMMAVLAERERQMRELQTEFKEYKNTSFNELSREKQLKQALKDEIVALHGQVEYLKTKYLEGQRQISELKEDLKQLREAHQRLLKEHEDASEANARCEILQNELEQAKAEASHIAEQLEVTAEELHHAEERADASASSLTEALNTMGHLEEQLEASQSLVESLSKEKTLMQEKAFVVQNEKEDAEARLKIAHFHLAKKVKETTLLEDKSADLQRRLDEASDDLLEVRNELLSLRQSGDEIRQQEEKRHQALITSIQLAENDAKGWKEKYFMGMEKWRHQEQRLSELKLLEEKLLKMKSLWSGFGNFFDDPSSGLPQNPPFERPDGDHQ